MTRTHAQVHHARDDDQQQCPDLGDHEEVLEFGGDADIPAVDEREPACKREMV